MPITNQTLENELDNVANSQEKAHIRKLWDHADSLMQEISVNLIQGNNTQVDELTKQALENGFDANTILDQGLIAGMAIVGIKFRDNLILFQRSLLLQER